MRSPINIKNRTENILNEISGIKDEDFIDSGGNETSFTDYNFDILRQHYAGTDFEAEANSLCDIFSEFHTKNGEIQSLVPLIMKIKELLIGEDNNIISGFEPYDDFIQSFISFIGNGLVSKSASSTDQPIPPLSDVKDLPNMRSAQAKLIELEQYLDSMNLSKRKTWQEYLDAARQKAAVGDDNFDATPELSERDIEYLREQERQKQKRTAKTATLEGLIGE
jgi:hypothetical protein